MIILMKKMLLPFLVLVGSCIIFPVFLLILVADDDTSTAEYDPEYSLEPITVYVTVSEDTYEFSGTKDEDGEVFFTFSVTIKRNSFVYGSDDLTMYLVGDIEDGELIVTGGVLGIEIAFKGTVSDDSFIMYGYYGDNAALAISGDWLNPFGSVSYTITGVYGVRTHPVTGEIKQHDGYDLVSDVDGRSPVYAASSGTVTYANWYSGYGNCVIIDHGDGIKSVYGHLSSITVSAGDEVVVGEMIGVEGSTGISTGDHLHFEVRVDGIAVDGAVYYSDLYKNASAISIW